MAKIIAAIFLTYVTTMAFNEVGLIPECKTEAYQWYFPLQILFVASSMMFIGFMVAKEK